MPERPTVYELTETDFHNKTKEEGRLNRLCRDLQSQINETEYAQTICKRFYAPNRTNRFGTLQSLHTYANTIHKTTNSPSVNGLLVKNTLLNDDLYQEIYQVNPLRAYNYLKKAKSLRSFKNCKTKIHLGKRTQRHNIRSTTDIGQLMPPCLRMTQRNVISQINNNAKVSGIDDGCMRGHTTEKSNEHKRKYMRPSQRFQKHTGSNSVKPACLDSIHSRKPSKLQASGNKLEETIHSVRKSRMKCTKTCKLCFPKGKMQRDLQIRRKYQSLSKSGRNSAIVDSTKNNTVSAEHSRKRDIRFDQFSSVTEKQVETPSVSNVLPAEYTKLKHRCNYLSWLTRLLKSVSRLSRYMIRSHVAAPSPHTFLIETKNQNSVPMEVDETVEVADFTTPCLSSCSHSNVCEERGNLLADYNSPPTTIFRLTEDNSEGCDVNHADLTKNKQSSVSSDHFSSTIRSMRADVPKEIARIAKEAKFCMRPQLATSEYIQTPVTCSADTVDNQCRGNAGCNYSNGLSDTPTEPTQQSNNNGQ